jgi:hypothetical protein
MADPEWAEFEEANEKSIVRPRDDFIFRFGQYFEAGLRSKVGDIVYNPSDGLIYRNIKETKDVAPDYTNATSNLYWTWIAGAPQDTWHEVGAAGEPAFQNGWVNFGGVYSPVSFRKDSAGVVHIQGLVKSGTLGTTIFTLPGGYRPSIQLLNAVLTSDALGRLDILTDGSVLESVGTAVYFSVLCSFYVGW